MPNPRIPQGVINRVRASIDFPDYPALRISASFLTPEGISVSNGQLGEPIPSMTGVVSSPQPYTQMTITAHLQRSQSLAQLFRNQIEKNTFLNTAKLYSDSSVLGDFTLNDVQITGLDGLNMNGKNADFAVQFTGTWYINEDMWIF
ncbi:hypothetical protein ACR9GP_05835 [Enterobacter ludwigii]